MHMDFCAGVICGMLLFAVMLVVFLFTDGDEDDGDGNGDKRR